MRKPKQMTRYEYKGWLIKRHPNSFAEKYIWSANLIDETGYLAKREGFNSERACKVFVDSFCQRQ